MLPSTPCPTKRAPDVWESARFTGIFLASSFPCSQTLSTPAHTQVTQTVSLPTMHRNRMKNESVNKQGRFLVGWSILNLLGWAIGIYFVFKIADNLEFIKHLAWKYNLAKDFRKEWIGETALVWFPLGLSIGILQWVKLRRFCINLFAWAFATAIGGAIFVTLYSWVLNFGSFEYRMKYDITSWVINVGLAVTMPIGGAIIGGLQSAVIRKHISRPELWIRVYIFGLLLPTIVTPFAILVKSFLLNIFYSSEFLYNFVDIRWFLFFGFLIIITAVSISILTGNVLLKQSNINSVTIKAG